MINFFGISLLKLNKIHFGVNDFTRNFFNSNISRISNCQKVISCFKVFLKYLSHHPSTTSIVTTPIPFSNSALKQILQLICNINFNSLFSIISSLPIMIFILFHLNLDSIKSENINKIKEEEKGR